MCKQCPRKSLLICFTATTSTVTKHALGRIAGRSAATALRAHLKRELTRQQNNLQSHCSLDDDASHRNGQAFKRRRRQRRRHCNLFAVVEPLIFIDMHIKLLRAVQRGPTQHCIAFSSTLLVHRPQRATPGHPHMDPVCNHSACVNRASPRRTVGQYAEYVEKNRA